MPVAGAVVGGGFNSYFTAKVCDAASNLYRKCCLAEKYGADVIEVTVEPTKDIESGYAESGEEFEPNSSPARRFATT